MKLRNKKTGEIGYTGLAADGLLPVDIEGRVAGNAEQRYRTLAELNADWEDVPEEPKEDGLDHIITLIEAYSSLDDEYYPKEIVEKLKAWKRLKEKGLRFDGYDVAHKSNGNLVGQIFYDAGDYFIEEIDKEMAMLFGGEE